MTEIDVAEPVLEALASKLPGPNAAASIAGVAGGLLGSRALDLYRGFLDSVGGRSAVAPAVLARPLVELAILLRWIRDDAETRFQAWSADSEGQDAKAIRQLARHLPRPSGDPFGPEMLQPILDEKDALAAAGKTVGEETPRWRLPGLVEMIDAVVKHDNDEGLPLRQAYDLAFRSLSSATHSAAHSFKESLPEQPDGSVAFVEASPVPIGLLRLLAAACMAYAIESAANLTERPDIAEAALAIRLRLAEPE